MAGIGGGIAPQTEQQPMAASKAPIADPQEEQPNVTPEEQAMYEAFVNNSLEVIYPKGEQAAVSPAIAQHLQGQFDEQVMQFFAEAQPPLQASPTDNLAVAGVLLTLMLESSAETSGQQLPDEIVMHGGVAILEELAEVAEASGIHDYSQEELEAATYRAFDLYRVSSPRVDQQALTAEFEQVVAADKAGQLGQIAPGIEQRMAA